MERETKDYIRLIRHLPKSTRRNTKMIHATYVENSDTIRKIALNGNHGLKRNVSLVLFYVSNQIWKKFLVVVGGLTSVVQFMFPIQCRDSL